MNPNKYPNDMRSCKTCGEIKHLDEFYPSKVSKHRKVVANCKVCSRISQNILAKKRDKDLERAYQRKHYAANRKRVAKRKKIAYDAEGEKWRKRFKDKVKTDPIGVMLMTSKTRAKRRGVKFSLTKDDIVIPSFCPVLGIPLFRGDKVHTPNSPSLDRINSTKGYTPDNVIVISFRANGLKRNGTPQEIARIAEFYSGDWDDPTYAEGVKAKATLHLNANPSHSGE